MQMPLCFPEKITSGPADMGVMGADPEGIGAKGVARAGGTMPERKVTEIKRVMIWWKWLSLSLVFICTSPVDSIYLSFTRSWRAHHRSNSTGRRHGCRESHLCFSSISDHDNNRKAAFNLCLVWENVKYYLCIESVKWPEESSGGPLWNLSVTSSAGASQDQCCGTRLFLLYRTK